MERSLLISPCAGQLVITLCQSSCEDQQRPPTVVQWLSQLVLHVRSAPVYAAV